MRVIGGSLRGRHLDCPKGLDVRPTSSMLRESLFNICQQDVPSSRFLDLYAGTGAVGIEAISRGAEDVFFVESDNHAVQCIKKNLERMGVLSSAHVLHGDVRLMMRKVLINQKPFDIVYIDPPYRFFENKEYLETLLKELLDHEIVKKDSRIFVESSYDKERFSNPVIIDGIECEKSKKAGSAQLTIYRVQ